MQMSWLISPLTPSGGRTETGGADRGECAISGAGVSRLHQGPMPSRIISQSVTCNLQLQEIDASMPDDQAFRRGNEGFRALSKTDDYREGPKAFIEKRPPRWTGKKPPGWGAKL